MREVIGLGDEEDRRLVEVAGRKRGSTSSSDVVANEKNREHSVQKSTSAASQVINENWRNLAEEIYSARGKSYKSNYVYIKRVFNENEEHFAPLLLKCPKFMIILSYILEDRLGLWVEKVSWTKDLTELDGDDCRRIGCSLATFIRKRKTGDAALDAWKIHYPQLRDLFDRIEGFEAFMLVLSNNILRDR